MCECIHKIRFVNRNPQSAIRCDVIPVRNRSKAKRYTPRYILLLHQLVYINVQVPSSSSSSESRGINGIVVAQVVNAIEYIFIRCALVLVRSIRVFSSAREKKKKQHTEHRHIRHYRRRQCSWLRVVCSSSKLNIILRVYSTIERIGKSSSRPATGASERVCVVWLGLVMLVALCVMLALRRSLVTRPERTHTTCIHTYIGATHTLTHFDNA